MEPNMKSKATSPFTGLRAGLTSSLRFRITEQMLNRFAHLTGDYNSLHSDREFARRLMFRDKVVHGILPVAFFPLLPILKGTGFRCSLTLLSGNFVAPVFIGDPLLFKAKIKNVNAQDLTLNYFIRNKRTNKEVITGEIILNYSPSTPPPKSTSQESISKLPSLVNTQLKESILTIDEVTADSRDHFNFSITDAAIHSFLDVLAPGIRKEPKDDMWSLTEHFSFHNLLASLLLSTSVGMCIPGKYATFLRFSIKFLQEIEQDVLHTLEGRISHVSHSTKIVTKQVSIKEATSKTILTGDVKLSALVNNPPKEMPSFHYLKQRATDMKLRDKVVLVTGASRGIGETIAKLFAALGSKTIVNYYRGATDADRIVAEIRHDGGQAIAIQADVSKYNQVRKMIQSTLKIFGPVDILINNAVKDFKSIPFLETSWNDMQKDIDVTLKGAFNCCKAVVPIMIENGGGKIINIGTVATDSPPPHQTKYVVSKSGLDGLTRSLAVEFASENIQFNMISPNFVETDLVAHIADTYRKKIASDTPMQRLASPLDIAQTAVFLASSFSSFITGQKVYVTGGAPPFS
jgi:3-oxoacyl-[acyl-carrier protein] reductase